jgi:hypothetical protein
MKKQNIQIIMLQFQTKRILIQGMIQWAVGYRFSFC